MKNMKKMACFALIALFLFTGCGPDVPDVSDSNSSDVSVSIQGETTTTSTSDTSDTTTEGDSSTTEFSGSTTKTTTSKTSTPTTTSGKPTSLTRDQVIANMPKELKGTTITMFFWEDLKDTICKNAILEFEAKTGIKVKTLIGTKDSYTSQIAAKITAGQSPDIVKVLDGTSGNLNNLQPLNNTGFNFNDTAWDSWMSSMFTRNGKLYATTVKYTPITNTGIILYNKKALRKAEMEDPYEIWKKDPSKWTWDKLWSMCDEFLTANRNREGYYGISFGVLDAYPRAFGATLWDYSPTAGKFVSNMKSAEVAKRYEILVNAVEKKWAAPASNGTAFTMGHILFSFSFSSQAELGNTISDSLGDNLGYAPIPTDSTYQPGYEYNVWGIPVGAKNAAAVPYYMRYVFAPESYDLNNFYKTEQAKEVCQSMIHNGKQDCYGYGWTWSIWNQMTNGTSSQVKTILDANVGTIEDKCFVENDAMLSLSK